MLCFDCQEIEICAIECIQNILNACLSWMYCGTTVIVSNNCTFLSSINDSPECLGSRSRSTIKMNGKVMIAPYPAVFRISIAILYDWQRKVSHLVILPLLFH